MTEMETLYKASEIRIGCIFVDDSSCMIKLRGLIGNKYHTVFPVHFEQYDSKQIQSILMHKATNMFKETHLSQDECKRLIKSLVECFICMERRVDHFCQYLAMLMPDIVKMSNNESSNRNVNNSNDSVHQSIMALFSKMSMSRHGFIDYMSTESLMTPIKSEQREPDLPYASKLLLLSAYLASFNARPFNQAQFAATQKKRSRVKKRAQRRKNEHSLMVLGPRQFNLRDLSGIFVTLFKRNAPSELNKDLRHIHDIRYQISHLISLNFISVVSKEGVLDDAKLQCNIDHEFAEFIAEKIGIENWECNLESTALA